MTRPVYAFLSFSGMTRGIEWPDPVRMRIRHAEAAYSDASSTCKAWWVNGSWSLGQIGEAQKRKFRKRT